MTGKRPEALDELVEFPEDMKFVWSYFIALHNRRTSNGFGLNPISYQEILAYFVLIQYQPQEWEVGLITSLDLVFLEEHIRQQEREHKKKSK